MRLHHVPKKTKQPAQPAPAECLDRIRRLNRDLEKFLQRSIDAGFDLEHWTPLSKTFKPLDCRELTGCDRRDCPVDCQKNYRCWLEVGTLCGNQPQGGFETKYRSCLQCEVFKKLKEDPVREVYENINTIIFHLHDRALKLRDLAIRDPLTGLYNRHFFNEVIGREISRAERRAEPLSFLMIDLDHLKQVNDTLGHLAGDKMLQETAGVLISQCRQADLVFRFGGDEFLAFLIGADEVQADLLTQRIHGAVGLWNQEHARAFGAHLSLSIGAASCRSCDALEALKQADERMYAAKQEKKKNAEI